MLTEHNTYVSTEVVIFMVNKKFWEELIRLLSVHK
jgi:hypothetical protein